MISEICLALNFCLEFYRFYGGHRLMNRQDLCLPVLVKFVREVGG